MKVELDPDEVRLLIDALSHWDAYLISQRRESDEVQALLRRLQRLLK